MLKSNTCQEIAGFLQERNIGYKRYSHKPIFTVDDGREIAEHFGVAPCKTLFLENRQHQYYMLMTAAERKVSLTDFAHKIGSSRLSFAKHEALASLLHTSPGAVSPLGLIFDVNHTIKLYIDASLQHQPYIVLHPCVNTESYIFTSFDFFSLFLSALNKKEPMLIELA